MARVDSVLPGRRVRRSGLALRLQRPLNASYNAVEHITVGRERAGGISVASIAREQGSLATATAEIDFAPIAAAAGLWHPGSSAKLVERHRFGPYPRQRVLTDVIKVKPLDLAGCGTGKYIAHGVHRQITSAPTVHAGLGAIAIVVRQNIEDVHSAAKAYFGGLRDPVCFFQLSSGRQQRFFVFKGPTVELR